MKDTVMIVDDLITNRLMLATMLEDSYNIIEAEDGKEAIKILGGLDDESLPSVILLDIMMPGVNGFGVMEYIKSLISDAQNIKRMTGVLEGIIVQTLGTGENGGTKFVITAERKGVDFNV